MFKKIEGIYNVGKTVFKKLKGNKQKTTGTEVIKSVTPNPQTADSARKITLAKITGQAKNKFMPVMRDLEKTGTRLRQTNQAISGRKITESGFNKAKDLARDKKMGGGMMGRRMGYRIGTPKPKTNVQKIKETFGPKKKLSPKQMKIAKLAGDPKRIDAPDFKKLRGKA